MAEQIVVDPITRIEGHLRIECEVDGGHVFGGWQCGTERPNCRLISRMTLGSAVG